MEGQFRMVCEITPLLTQHMFGPTLFYSKSVIQIILKHCHSYLFAEPQQPSQQGAEPQLPSQQGAEPQLPSQQIVAPQDHQQGTPQQQEQQHRRKRDEARIAVSPADICPLPCAPSLSENDA